MVDREAKKAGTKFKGEPVILLRDGDESLAIRVAPGGVPEQVF